MDWWKSNQGFSDLKFSKAHIYIEFFSSLFLNQNLVCYSTVFVNELSPISVSVISLMDLSINSSLRDSFSWKHNGWVYHQVMFLDKQVSHLFVYKWNMGFIVSIKNFIQLYTIHLFTLEIKLMILIIYKTHFAPRSFKSLRSIDISS